MVDVSPPQIKRSTYWNAQYDAAPGTTEGLLRYDRDDAASASARPPGTSRSDGPGGSESALAPLTKSVHAFSESTDRESGEFQRFTIDSTCGEVRRIADPFETSSAARTQRYQLQRIARDILSSHDRKRPINSGKRAKLAATGEGVGTSPWRVTWCNWRAFEDPTVWVGEDHTKAHFKGLAVCGSVWTCPICAAKISNLRAEEIKRACDQHHENGGSLVMCTLTFSHSRQDNLKALIGDSKRSRGLRAALRIFRNSRTFKTFKEDTGITGFIRNLEVTYGDANGWHPHVHELWFLPYAMSDRAMARLKSQLFAAWKSACLKAGLSPPNRKRGVDLLGVISPSEYMAKIGHEQRWGAHAEMTKSHIKKGRFQSMTPFDLLRCVAEGGSRSGEARTRFAEYAAAFHGSRQCYWTPGLKAHFSIQDISDEEAAKKEAEKSYLVARIAKATWKRVLRYPFEARGIILRLAETGGEDAVIRFLAPG